MIIPVDHIIFIWNWFLFSILPLIRMNNNKWSTIINNDLSSVIIIKCDWQTYDMEYNHIEYHSIQNDSWSERLEVILDGEALLSYPSLQQLWALRPSAVVEQKCEQVKCNVYWVTGMDYSTANKTIFQPKAILPNKW